MRFWPEDPRTSRPFTCIYDYLVACGGVMLGLLIVRGLS